MFAILFFFFGSAVATAAASQQEGCEFDSNLGFSVWGPHVLSGSSGFLPQSKDVHVGSIGDSKLSVGGGACVVARLSVLALATCPGVYPANILI